MRFEIRTLTRAISTLVILAMLVVGASIGASAQGHSHFGRSHNRGRHLGWTNGRHRGWSHSNHYGVGRNDTADIFRSRHRNNNGVTLRRDDRDRDLDARVDRDERGARGERMGLGRGAGHGRGVGHGRGRP